MDGKAEIWAVVGIEQLQRCEAGFICHLHIPFAWVNVDQAIFPLLHEVVVRTWGDEGLYIIYQLITLLG